jgi:hypothetical protein
MTSIRSERRSLCPFGAAGNGPEGHTCRPARTPPPYPAPTQASAVCGIWPIARGTPSCTERPAHHDRHHRPHGPRRTRGHPPAMLLADHYFRLFLRPRTGPGRRTLLWRSMGMMSYDRATANARSEKARWDRCGWDR